MSTGDDDIVVRNLSVTYTSRGVSMLALDSVSFTVARGQMCCVVGPSGCGKSTLLRAALDLIKPSSGEVHLNPQRRERGIAFVQQDSPLLPWRTALQNACLGAEIQGERSERRNATSQVREPGKLNPVIVERVRRTLNDFGLEGFENHITAELSGGMRQRVAITRALEARPELLFCDEPFSAVDFVGRLSLSSQFKKMCRVAGISTLFVTHNIEEAIFLGDTIVVMTGRPGRVKHIYHPPFVECQHAVECREAPEFGALFKSIWDDLGQKYG